MIRIATFFIKVSKGGNIFIKKVKKIDKISL